MLNFWGFFDFGRRAMLNSYAVTLKILQRLSTRWYNYMSTGVIIPREIMNLPFPQTFFKDMGTRSCLFFLVHFLFACLCCRLVLAKELRRFRKQIRHRKRKEESKKIRKIRICFSLMFCLVLTYLHLTNHQWSL